MPDSILDGFNMSRLLALSVFFLVDSCIHVGSCVSCNDAIILFTFDYFNIEGCAHLHDVEAGTALPFGRKKSNILWCQCVPHMQSSLEHLLHTWCKCILFLKFSVKNARVFVMIF